MDQNKWKSVVVPRDVYHDLRIIANIEGRALSRQLRFIVEEWKETREDQTRSRVRRSRY